MAYYWIRTWSSMLSFQKIILELQNYWQDYGCAILQPCGLEMKNDLLIHPTTFFRLFDDKSWKAAEVRLARNKTHAYQFQITLKPSPGDIKELYIKSLEYLGIIIKECDMTIFESFSSFNYINQIGGIELKSTISNLTYYLEPLALYIQGQVEVKNIDYNGQKGLKSLTYGQVHLESEKAQFSLSTELMDLTKLDYHFNDAERECNNSIQNNIPISAYEYYIKADYIYRLIKTKKSLDIAKDRIYQYKLSKLLSTVCNNHSQLMKN